MPKKTKVKVLVKIFTIGEDGDEDQILRQFVVEGKEKSEEVLAFNICDSAEQKFKVSEIESWVQYQSTGEENAGQK